MNPQIWTSNLHNFTIICHIAISHLCDISHLIRVGIIPGRNTATLGRAPAIPGETSSAIPGSSLLRLVVLGTHFSSFPEA